MVVKVAKLRMHVRIPPEPLSSSHLNSIFSPRVNNRGQHDTMRFRGSRLADALRQY
jgi:hypothetical protein